MNNPQLSFEQILNATVRMLRTTWKAEICLFLQMDDTGDLRVRAADGLEFAKVSSLTIKPAHSPFALCLTYDNSISTKSFEAIGFGAQIKIH